MTAQTQPRLITPTGVLHADIDPISDRDTWLAARRLGIGSSDIPTLVGADKYATVLDLWLDKRGELPDTPAGEAAAWGMLLEDVIATRWAVLHDTTVERAPILAHVDHPWRLASLDRVVTRCPGLGLGAVLAEPVCALEVKTRSAWKAGSWREDVPDDVLAQTQWQLHVTGLDHIHVACLIGGQRLVEHVADPDPQVIDYITGEADRLWDAVQTGVAPYVDPSALLIDLLDRLHPNREGHVALPAVQVEDIRRRYVDAQAAAKAAEEAKDAAKAELVVLLGAADTAVVGDGEHARVAATYKPTMRASTDLDLLKASWPDAYAACVTRKPTRPVLRWKD